MDDLWDHAQRYSLQWNRVHFSGAIAVEDFASPMIDVVRALQKHVQTRHFTLPVQQEFAAFWQQHTMVIQHLTDRTERLGSMLQTEQFDTVVCHGDVHAAHSMLDADGNLFLVDWDTPRIAPRERDLLFIIGSTIERRVTPHEERHFFQGYGATRIHWRAMTYYRYERVLEERYAGGQRVFCNPVSSVAVQEADAQFTMRLFQSGDLVQSALAADKRGDDNQWRPRA